MTSTLALSRSYPPDVSPPVGEISATNQSGLILVIASMALSSVLIALAIRLHVRVTNRSWKTEDFIFASAVILSVVHFVIVYYEIHLGLGRLNILGGQVSNLVLKWYFANDILYVLVLAVSKLATASLYLHLALDAKHIIVIWSVIGLCIIWAVASLLLLLVHCIGAYQCSDSYHRWIIIGASDCISEVAVVLVSVYLIRNLRLPLSQKVIVVSVFAARLFNIPIWAVRLHYLNPASLSTNRVLATSLVVVLTQLQIGCVMLAASVSCLRPFVAVYEKVHSSQYSNRRTIPTADVSGLLTYPELKRSSNSRTCGPVAADLILDDGGTIETLEANERAPSLPLPL